MKKINQMCSGMLFLLIIGGINLGLIGLGMLIGSDLNVVASLIGKWPAVEAILYIIIGLASIKAIIVMLMCKKGNCSI